MPARKTYPRSSRDSGERRDRDARDKRFDRDGTGRGERGTRIFRKKTCRFCTDRIDSVDYKEADILRRFLTEKGKIMPRRITGTCSTHQRRLARAIKRSRHSGLIPFQTES